MKSRAVIALVLASLCACSTPKPDQRPDDGLVLVPDSRLAELYVAPGVSLASYPRYMLDPIEVVFDERWRKDHPELDDREAEQLRTRLAEALEKAIVKELGHGSYSQAEAPDKDVMRIRAKLVDIDLAAPASSESAGMRTLVRSHGEITLQVEIFDAPSGALIARAEDYLRDPDKHRLEWATRASNALATHRMFQRWAEEIRSALDVAKVKAGARTLSN